MSIEIFGKILTDGMILRILEEEFDRAAVVNRHYASGFIPKGAYDVTRDAFKMCIGCGSSTQPCCGH